MKDESLDEDDEFLPDVEEPEDEEALAGAEAEVEAEEPAEESLDEILAKPEERPAGEEEEEDDESILSLETEERVEPLAVRVKPIERETEFVCSNCHLVKPIRSQLADKKRKLCRDCV